MRNTPFCANLNIRLVRAKKRSSSVVGRIQRIAVAITALCVIAAPLMPAKAGYLVTIHTFDEVPTDGLGIADYNYPYPTVIGANIGPGTSQTVIGTTDTTGTLTSASEQITGTYSPAGITSTAYAAGDLTTGQLHLNATDNSSCNGICNGVGNFAGEDTFAQLQDTLHFTVAGADADTVTPITFVFAVDGTLVQTSSYGQGYVRASLNLNNEGAQVSYNQDLNSGTNNLDVATAPLVNGWASRDYSVLTSNQALFEGTFDIIGSTSDVLVDLQMEVNCSDGMTCNFDNTGSVDLILPSGVTYTSDSGVFLSGLSPTSVPEPSSLAGLASAIGGVAVALRRRRSPNGDAAYG